MVGGIIVAKSVCSTTWFQYVDIACRQLFKEYFQIWESREAFRIIPSLVPDKAELVWFIAEDDQLPFYPVYESNVQSIPQIVGKCYGFEYYIVQKQFDWLLCDNHHDTLIGVGKAVEMRIKALVAQQNSGAVGV